MADDFKPGDVVQLKSGGPKMTVDKADRRAKKVHCTWFAGRELEFGTFDFGIISLVPQDETRKG